MLLDFLSQSHILGLMTPYDNVRGSKLIEGQTHVRYSELGHILQQTSLQFLSKHMSYFIDCGVCHVANKLCQGKQKQNLTT